jgi:hypothetical protein
MQKECDNKGERDHGPMVFAHHRRIFSISQ